MNQTIANPFALCKRQLSIAWLTWQIRDLNDEMAEYREALSGPDGLRHCTYINGKLKKLIRQQRALCDRRDALRNEVS